MVVLNWRGPLQRASDLLRLPPAVAQSWGARVLTCVVMSALVAFATKVVETRFREGIDASVQATLASTLPPAAPLCDPSDPSGPACVALVGIDEHEFRTVFRQRSPLDPDEIAHFLAALLTAPPRVLAIDLDLSPADEEDWPARQRLQGLLQQLATQTRVVMVCPQGYSLNQPSEFDRRWVSSFGPEVRFAVAELDADGLYYHPAIGPLGVEAARAVQGLAAAPAGDWHAHCSRLHLGAVDHGEPRLIRPQAVEALSYVSAREDPQQLRDRVVVFGGLYGTADRFALRGAAQAQYGVTLHAWVALGELAPAQAVPASAGLALDVVVGLVAGAVFAWLWAAIARHRKSFARRMALYGLFLGFAVLLPGGLLLASVALAQFGLLLGVAGMVISVMCDSFFSSHERLMEPAADTADSAGETSKGWRAWVRWAALLLLGAATIAALSRVGTDPWACALVGLGAWVVLRFGFPVPPAQPEPANEDGAWDHAARLLWVLVRWGILAYTFLAAGQAPAAMLVAGFLGPWLWFDVWRAARAARPPAVA